MRGPEQRQVGGGRQWPRFARPKLRVKLGGTNSWLRTAVPHGPVLVESRLHV
jgi:hypothetical protein